MIKITLEYTTMEEAITAMAVLRGGTGTAAAPTPTPEKVTAGKSVTTDKSAAGKPVVKDTPAPAAEKKEPASSGSATDVVAAYEPVGAAITSAVKSHRAEVIELLGTYGAKNGRELKPEDYGSFLEKLAAITTVSEVLG